MDEQNKNMILATALSMLVILVWMAFFSPVIFVKILAFLAIIALIGVYQMLRGVFRMIGGRAEGSVTEME